MKPGPWLLILMGCLSLRAHGTPPQKGTGFVQAYGPSYSSLEDSLRRLDERTEAIARDVAEIKGHLKAGTPANDALGVIAKRCLSCHQAPAAKGDDFVIVRGDGTLEELPPGYRAAIVRKVQKGEMPPAGKLPEAEIKLLSEFFAEKPQENKQK